MWRFVCYISILSWMDTHFKFDSLLPLDVDLRLQKIWPKLISKWHGQQAINVSLFELYFRFVISNSWKAFVDRVDESNLDTFLFLVLKYMVQVFQMVSNNFPNMLLGVAFKLQANIFQRPISPNFTDIRPFKIGSNLVL